MTSAEVPAGLSQSCVLEPGTRSAAAPQLSVVIVNWNTRDDLLACLGSLDAALAGLSAEVLVVDNASGDGSAEAVKRRFPRARLIENHRNAGFARANNQAFRLARGRYLLLLNPDTLVAEDAMRGLIDFMDATPRAGAAGLQLKFPDGRLQNSYDSFPTFGSELISKHLMRLLFPARYPSKRTILSEPTPVDIVIGACLILRREVVETLGGFDERYFLFVEEADLCFRIWQAGWQVHHLPHLSIVHDAKASKAQATAHAYIEYARSSYRFYRKSMSLPLALSLRALKALKVVLINPCLSLVAFSFTLGKVERHRRRLKIRAHLCAWHLLGCPPSWGMRRVSPFREYERVRAPGRELIVHASTGPKLRALLDSWSGLAGGASPAARASPAEGPLADPDSGTPLIVRVFRGRGLLGRLRALRAGPEGLDLLEKAEDARDRDLPAAAPLAAGAVSRCGLPSFSFAVFREERGLAPLAERLRDPGPNRDEALRAGGRFLRRLHDAGADLGSDAPAAISVSDDPGAPECLIIARVSALRLGPPLRRGERLAALREAAPAVPGLTPLERRRFLIAYFGSRREGRRPRKLRVLHLFSNHKVTGPAETALDAARALESSGAVEAAFVAGRDRGSPGGLRRLAAARGARTADLPLHLRKHFAPPAIASDVRRLREHLRADAPDAIHCHLPGDHLVASLAAPAGMPIVRSLYDGEPPDWDWRARRVLGRHAARLACFSRAVLSRLAADPYRIPPELLVHLEPPIDLARFDPARPLPDRRAALGIPAGAFTAGIAARLQTHRRFEVLFQAIHLARREIPDLRFVVIGRGTYAREVAAAPVRELGLEGTVCLTGYLEGESYVAMLRALDAAVFLVPGSDGTCRAVREALAMGLPVVAARRGMLPELIRDGETGLLIDDTPENLASALVRLARDRENLSRMKAAARADAVSRFSFAAHALALTRLYREALEEAGPAHASRPDARGGNRGSTPR